MTYQGRALQLANRIYGHCSRTAGEPPVLHSANDNGFADPCDALARLGVAEPFLQRDRYRPWQPGDKHYETHVLAYSVLHRDDRDPPFTITRHMGEPSYKDLLRVLCQQAWFHAEKLRNLKIDSEFGDEERQFVDELIERGLGVWTADAGFEFHPHGWQAVSDDYWTARNLFATELGSEAALFPAAAD